jgi:hypothetical protein
MSNALKGHDGLMLTGALAALAFKPDGLTRRQRADVAHIAARSARATEVQIGRQIAALARRREHVRTREEEISVELRALRCEQLGLRYGRPRVEDHLRRLLRHHPQADHLFDGAFGPNLIVNAGEAYLVDAWQNSVELENMKYHGCGTGNTAAAEGDTALQTESTTALNPDNTRATGSLTEASASVFRTVGTLTFDNTAAVVEWGLFSQAATGGGTLWSRVVFSAINVASADAIQFTYDLTVE